jgi:hypothetical protein
MRIRNLTWLLDVVLLVVTGPVANACSCPGWTSVSGSWTAVASATWTMTTDCCDGDAGYYCVSFGGTLKLAGAAFEDAPECSAGDATIGSFTRICCSLLLRNQKAKFVGCSVTMERDADTKWTGPLGEICFSGWGTPRTTSGPACGVKIIADVPKCPEDPPL